MLEIEQNALKFSPAFDECKKKLEEANESIRKADILRINPERIITHVFKRKIIGKSNNLNIDNL